MNRLQKIILLAILAITCAAWFYNGRNRGPRELRVTVLDVGQGDSILVETPDHHSMLIDGGGVNGDREVDTHNIGMKTVIPYLHYRGIDRLDIVALTHPHSDHAGGLASVVNEMKVDSVLDGTTVDYTDASYTAFMDAIRAQGIPYKHAARGAHIDFGDGVTADVLNPPASGTPYGIDKTDKVINNYSAVIRLTYGKTHFMLDGDAESEAEQSMIESGDPVDADVLKCGHHGSNNASSDAWLDRVHPKFAAISCGRHNHFGHPGAETMARLTSHGIRIFRTDKDGAIVFESDGNTVTAFKTIE